MYGIQDVLLGYAKAYAREFQRRPLPLFYSCGIRYRPEDPRQAAEEWVDPYTCKERGWGDCDDMVLWRCAEALHRLHWRDGEPLPCWPAVANLIDTETYHVVLRHRGKEQFEDPARIMADKYGDTYES